MAEISTRQALIAKISSNILIVTSVAAFVTIFCVISTKSLLGQIAYQNKASTVKSTQLEKFQRSEKSKEALVAAYKQFDSKDPNIIGGSRTGTGSKDGTSSKIVLDALPSKYDFPALATSLNNMLNTHGLTVVSFGGSDSEASAAATPASATPTPVAMPISFSVTGGYANVQSLLTDFNNSIRPFQVLSMSMAGSESSMTISVQLQTYYQPGKTLTIGQEKI